MLVVHDASGRPTECVSTQEIMDRLQVSRAFITKNITHELAHVAPEDFVDFPLRERTREYYYLDDVRAWLMATATFTRQTKFVDIYAEARRCGLDDASEADILGEIPLPYTENGIIYRPYDSRRRSRLQSIPVPAFDFWDLPLIFPKNYTTVDSLRGTSIDDIAAPRKLSPELCYREMFDQGAIKIQLGAQKTMFYVPPREGDTIIAADWIPGRGCPQLWEQAEEGVDGDEGFTITIESTPAELKALREQLNAIVEVIATELHATDDSQNRVTERLLCRLYSR